MVQTVYAPAGAADMDAVWKDAKAEDLMDSKLRCVFELPFENEKSNDLETSKSAAVTNAPKSEGLPMPKSVSTSLDDIEVRKLMEECKRLQAELAKITDENRQLKDDGLRLRKAAQSGNPVSSTSNAAVRDHGSTALPSLLVVIAAIFIGFFLGKFIL